MGMHKGFTHGAASVPKEQMEKRFGHGPAKPQQFLREYIEQKQAGLVGETKPQPKKKLTFEEWWDTNCSDGWWYSSVEEAPHYEHAAEIWKAAQENV